MVERHRLAAVVPVLDEAGAIGDVVAGLRAAGACCVFVVDGGSADGTPALAAAAGANVLTEPRRGYGRACITGAEAAIACHELVAFLDGDGSCDPCDLARLTAAAEDADLVLGVRHTALVERGALPWHARLGNRLVAAALQLRCGRRLVDLPPFKVVRADVLESLRLYLPRFTLTSVLAEVQRWLQVGQSCFVALLEKLNLTPAESSVLDQVYPSQVHLGPDG